MIIILEQKNITKIQKF